MVCWISTTLTLLLWYATGLYFLWSPYLFSLCLVWSLYYTIIHLGVNLGGIHGPVDTWSSKKRDLTGKNKRKLFSALIFFSPYGPCSVMVPQQLQMEKLPFSQNLPNDSRTYTDHSTIENLQFVHILKMTEYF